MKEINLAAVLTAKRRERKVTQEELAAIIGVTKASVSKWETGHGYPDITFLPLLASYFDISIDQLIGYTPQLTKPQIKQIHTRLSTRFSNEPFDDVVKECRELIKKYYSCYPFLLDIALLYLNHAQLAKDKDRETQILNSAVSLCEHIREESNDTLLIHTAERLLAFCHLMMMETLKVFDILGEDATYEDISCNMLLSQAYQANGQFEKAMEVTQIDIYTKLSSVFEGLLNYLRLNPKDFETANMTYERAEGLSRLFGINQLNPNLILNMYLLGVHMYLSAGHEEQALEELKKYTDVCIHSFFPYQPHGDAFFNKIDGWFAELCDMPRSEKLIKESMLHVLTAPEISVLQKYPDYSRLYQKLKDFIGGH